MSISMTTQLWHEAYIPAANHGWYFLGHEHVNHMKDTIWAKAIYNMVQELERLAG